MARTMVRLLLIILVGIVTGRLLLYQDGVRHALRFSPQPTLLTDAEGDSVGIDPSKQLLASSDPVPSPTPRTVRRISWQQLDHQRPKDPETDPTTGKTQILYLDKDREMRLSSVLATPKVPLPALRIGVITVGSRSVAGIEFWCGEPPSRTHIEEAAVRMIDICFDAIPELDEVDLIAVPWRWVHGYRPPAYFSVSARRVDHLPSQEQMSAREVLDSYGAAWWDPRVMSDFPAHVPPASSTAGLPWH